MEQKLYVLFRCKFDGDSCIYYEFGGIFNSIDYIPSDIKNYLRQSKKGGDFEKGFFTDDNLDKAPKDYEGDLDTDGFYIFKSITLNTFEYE